MTLWKIYAGIGSRDLSDEALARCREIAAELARDDWLLRTGGAPGADQAFCEGALEAGGKVIICLPWRSYEQQHWKWAKGRGAVVKVLNDDDREAWRSVDQYHPAPARLNWAARSLHARNFLIVRRASLCVAYPVRDERGGWGGTGQGMRIAEARGIEVRNLAA